MASLTARHRYCADRILLGLGYNDDLDETKVQAFIRKPKVLAKFDELFAGEGPSALFVHYQPRHTNELDAPDQKELSVSVDGKVTKKPELFVTVDVPTACRCV